LTLFAAKRHEKVASVRARGSSDVQLSFRIGVQSA
jgi:hypothetical protein